ncbi:hypothetical protein Ddc_23961 [Ditylenchus destructor]|nr:hypothetical protein Ddc_23961 [Ditylenchus destructor]
MLIFIFFINIWPLILASKAGQVQQNQQLAAARQQLAAARQQLATANQQLAAARQQMELQAKAAGKLNYC